MSTVRLSLLSLVLIALIHSAFPYCVSNRVSKFFYLNRIANTCNGAVIGVKRTIVFGVEEIGTDEGGVDDSMTGKVISCETTGSCGSVRRAYKQELNDIREQKRLSNVPMEDNYLDFLSGDKSAAKKSYSPFKKQYPPKIPPATQPAQSL